MVKKRYLIDTNTLATPSRQYYSFDLLPSFWKWLMPLIQNGTVVILDKVYNELKKGKDELASWLVDVPKDRVLSSRNAEILSVYQEILTYIQESPSYTDKALRAWAKEDTADPWLIAAAKVNGFELVMFEQSAGKIIMPSKNPKIPDIASSFQVNCISLFMMMRDEHFRI